MLLGATGTGKSATTAWLIEKLQRPTLVMAPNKTLAAQLANEFRELLPNNAVEYFVSYYDYYQPEAYVAQSDTYIEKDSSVNEEVERLRHSATSSLLTRAGRDRGRVRVLHLRPGYAAGVRRPDGPAPRSARSSGSTSCCASSSPSSTRATTSPSPAARSGCGATPWRSSRCTRSTPVRVEMFGDEIERLMTLHPVTGEILTDDQEIYVFPATPLRRRSGADGAGDRRHRGGARRAARGAASGRASCWRPSGCGCARTYDLEMMREVGFCNGIENYSRHIDGREAGYRRRTPCSTTSRTTSCWSSTSRTRPCRRSARCTRATPRASAPSSTSASGCPRPSTTGR